MNCFEVELMLFCVLMLNGMWCVRFERLYVCVIMGRLFWIIVIIMFGWLFFIVMIWLIWWFCVGVLMLVCVSGVSIRDRVMNNVMCEIKGILGKEWLRWCCVIVWVNIWIKGDLLWEFLFGMGIFVCGGVCVSGGGEGEMLLGYWWIGCCWGFLFMVIMCDCEKRRCFCFVGEMVGSW